MTALKLFIIVPVLMVLAACGGSTPKDYDSRELVPDACAHLDNLDDHWQPIWCDEFEEDGLPDPERWGYDVGGGGWGNQELQYYTNANTNNVFIEDGVLNIRAINESHQDYDYSSARIKTLFRGDWEYARIQVKAKMPSGTGTWPAIWMLPSEWRYGDWPASGEIDIIEYVGHNPGIVHGTIHTGAYNHNLNTQIGNSFSLPTAETEFHLYEMIWEPARIVLRIDGEQFATFDYNPEMNRSIENSDAWPFDQPFHLILNLAVGGMWGGQQGVDAGAFPTAMQVEYVRVYQKDYAGLSVNAPSTVEDLRVHWIEHDSARIAWDHATHDVAVSHYEITADDQLVGSTTLNAFNVRNLSPNQSVRLAVYAVDFAGNRSKAETVNIQTKSVRNILDTIQAETYDNMMGVRIVATDDTVGENHVSNISDSDFLEYVLEVSESGQYQVHYRVYNPDDAGEIRLFTRSPFPLVSTVIPAYQQWQTITSKPFTLNEGVHTFKFSAIIGGFDLNYIEFEKVD